MFVWAFANVHGLNVQSEQGDFLNFLSNFKSQWPIPWVFSGDFNIVIFPHEKKGRSFASRSMELFSNFISDNEFIDLPL